MLDISLIWTPPISLMSLMAARVRYSTTITATPEFFYIFNIRSCVVWESRGNIPGSVPIGVCGTLCIPYYNLHSKWIGAKDHLYPILRVTWIPPNTPGGISLQTNPSIVSGYPSLNSSLFLPGSVHALSLRSFQNSTYHPPLLGGGGGGGCLPRWGCNLSTPFVPLATVFFQTHQVQFSPHFQVQS